MTPLNGAGNVNVEDIDNTAGAVNIFAKPKLTIVAGEKTSFTNPYWSFVILMKKQRRHCAPYVESWLTRYQH
jgi:hypothetical protein